MSRSKLPPYVGNVAVEVGTSSIADRFLQVVAHISLEYNLPPDIWAAAEDVLGALRARKERAETDRRNCSVSAAARAFRPLWLLISSRL